MVIRKISEADAEAFVNLGKRLDEETKFMLLEPGERTTTAEEQSKRIGAVLASDNQMMFVAELEGVLVGFLAAFGGTANRNRDTAYLVIGILQRCAGQGVGTQLFTAMEAWAREVGIHRLELTVMTHNQAGLALYKKMGFAVEGTKPHTLKVDGVYVDEHVMGKLL